MTSALAQQYAQETASVAIDLATDHAFHGLLEYFSTYLLTLFT
jgi:hypothetical protein